MSEPTPDTGSAWSNALTVFIAALVVSAVLLGFGGRIHSLALIGIGTIVFFGTVIWAETGRQTSSGVVITLLPWILALYLVTAGLYFDSDPLWWVGFVLLIGYLVWMNRSELRWLVGRLQEEERDR